MITILPEPEGNVLLIEASARLTVKDYEEVFIPKIEQLIRQYGKIKIVFYLNDTFTGWEAGAVWDDAKFGLKHNQDVERVALVGGPRWVAWLTKVSALFLHAKVKTFDGTCLQEAIAWTKQ